MVSILLGIFGPIGAVISLIMWGHILWLKDVDEGDGVKFLAVLIYLPTQQIGLRDVNPQ